MSRKRRSSRLAVLGDRAASSIITVGGIGTIVAVVSIFFFLASVALPLFRGARIHEVAAAPALEGTRDAAPCYFAVDEQRLASAWLDAEGHFHIHRLDDGTSLAELAPFEAELGRPTAVEVTPEGDELLLGFADGRLARARVGFEASFPTVEELGDEFAAMTAGELRVFEGGLLERLASGKQRLTRLRVELLEVLDSELGEALVLVDAAGLGGELLYAAVTSSGRVALLRTETKLNFMTGEETTKVHAAILRESGDPPLDLVLAGSGENAYLIWPDGRLERYSTRDLADLELLETVDLVPQEDRSLTVHGFLSGRGTLVVGDSGGGLRAWFRTPAGLQAAHELESDGPAPRRLAVSSRSRLVACGFEGGGLKLYNVTGERRLAEVEGAPGALALTMLTKQDGLAALLPDRIQLWELDAGYPEAGVAAFFEKVWYEDYPAPAHVWQSESAADDFEPKYGFMPLVYGTLKATFYTMLFGAPLALLAAIFTSEFLDGRLRSTIKSTIEMMASLPSVVLGFLAALVIAPFAQQVLPATLVLMLVVPLLFLLGAFLWQLVPAELASRLAGWPKLVLLLVILPLGVLIALVVGPWMEGAFFAGDLVLWLDGQVGGARSGWMLLALPAVGVTVFLLGGRLTRERVAARLRGRARGVLARFELLRFGAGVLLTLGLSYGLAALLESAGADPRGGLLDTYVQRNALVVGFVMGFAVIPIIYTLADDALRGVPQHLREASYGAGATPWQTAIRVVVPTAMSGIFSALMIGLGRAVGETMIVLMATGNTPIMEANVFNGLRTLSANIAVELPEAVQGSTHYRTLFLAALVLFAMTFVLNTLAEVVRMRFRKNALEL